MNFKIGIIALFLSLIQMNAQEVEDLGVSYRGEREKVNNLVHTKLNVSFDFAKRHLLGEAWLTLTPHFYPTSTLTLDAKSMLIHEVSQNGKALTYDYKDNKLVVNLGRTYLKGIEYTIYIKYTARPEEVKQEGSAAISDAKGLYFIDPEQKDAEKPTQIWTQGETESSSCWFPTIDSPNQKTSQEIYMRVPENYVTLSNGLLVEQTKNSDGTRTDYWKLEQKHAPYLFFMGVGEYSIVKDKWKNIDVDYYVEPAFEAYAKDIFGLTPEMIDFYSSYTGLDYMWPKYAQMVARDYVSGAMENTTAVLHAENAQQVPGQLIDENSWEYVIAHELFHHWFGDYVTAESWSNLTVNESFANYGEYLWIEHKYGKDEADAHRHDEIQGYLAGGNELKDLVRFQYESREDMFDAVSYNKGGTILHMLRNYLGDDAFRAGIKQYLTDHAYGTGEAHQLRLAMEKVSGKDLNWFFNQWYFNHGHPKLEVKYDYNDQSKLVAVSIKQTQSEIFEFPLTIQVYEGGKPKTYPVWIDKKEQAFSFKYNKRPDLVNVDSDRILLAEITDSKTTENYVHQYLHAAKYEDRREAIDHLGEHQADKIALTTLSKALQDPYYGLRILAINKIDISRSDAGEAIKSIEKLAQEDPKTLVRAAAIEKLSITKDEKYNSLYNEALKSQSYSVQSAALAALFAQDPQLGLASLERVVNDKNRKYLKEALIPIYIQIKNDEQMPFVAENLIEGMFFTDDKQTQNIYKEGFQWVVSSSNVEATQNLVDSFVDMGIKYKDYGADQMARQVLNQVLGVKQASQYSNKAEMVKIVEEGLTKL
ncbi:MAG: M1 family aminopeptidase [Lutimonas sp.]